MHWIINQIKSINISDIIQTLMVLIAFITLIYTIRENKATDAKNRIDDIENRMGRVIMHIRPIGGLIGLIVENIGNNYVFNIQIEELEKLKLINKDTMETINEIDVKLNNTSLKPGGRWVIYSKTTNMRDKIIRGKFRVKYNTYGYMDIEHPYISDIFDIDFKDINALINSHTVEEELYDIKQQFIKTNKILNNYIAIEKERYLKLDNSNKKYSRNTEKLNSTKKLNITEQIFSTDDIYYIKKPNSTFKDINNNIGEDAGILNRINIKELKFIDITETEMYDTGDINSERGLGTVYRSKEAYYIDIITNDTYFIDSYNKGIIKHFWYLGTKYRIERMTYEDCEDGEYKSFTIIVTRHDKRHKVIVITICDTLCCLCVESDEIDKNNANSYRKKLNEDKDKWSNTDNKQEE